MTGRQGDDEAAVAPTGQPRAQASAATPPPDEASVATPPRGVPRVPDPVSAAPARPVGRTSPHATETSADAPAQDPDATSSAGPGVTGFTTDAPAPLLPAAGRARGRWSTTVATVVALVLGLAGTAWFSTDHLRTTWLPMQPHVAAPVDDDGVADVAGLSVRLAEVTDLGPTPDLGGSDWQPPAGFHAWRVVLESSSTNAELFSCDVDLIDDRGRVFRTNVFVDSFVDGYEFSYTCGATEPGDDVGPEQALLAMAPAGTTMATVRISGTELDPDYIELEID